MYTYIIYMHSPARLQLSPLLYLHILISIRLIRNSQCICLLEEIYFTGSGYPSLLSCLSVLFVLMAAVFCFALFMVRDSVHNGQTAERIALHRGHNETVALLRHWRQVYNAN